MNMVSFPPPEALPRIPKLPSPLKLPDGSILTDPSQWPAQRDYLKALLEHYMFGQWPGIDHEVSGEIRETVRIGDTIRKEFVRLSIPSGIAFDLELTYRADLRQMPVMVYNSGPDQRAKATAELLAEGYVLAAYNREQIIPDIAKPGGPPPNLPPRPDLPCGDIMGWGWGSTLVVNYLEQRGMADGPLIATGHSRGGKAAACAAIYDDRFDVAAPMGSGCGGMGSDRFIGTLAGDRQDSSLCETIGFITHVIPIWFSPLFGSFGKRDKPHDITEREQRLPFDSHTLRACMAPRAVFDSEGTEDNWANPFGTQLAWQAAQPVFDLLGVPERNGYHIRPGKHDFSREDWLALITFCNRIFGKNPPAAARPINNPMLEIDAAEFCE